MTFGPRGQTTFAPEAASDGAEIDRLARSWEKGFVDETHRRHGGGGGGGAWYYGDLAIKAVVGRENSVADDVPDFEAEGGRG